MTGVDKGKSPRPTTIFATVILGSVPRLQRSTYQQPFNESNRLIKTLVVSQTAATVSGRHRATSLKENQRE
jgi:hypothetical protein